MVDGVVVAGLKAYCKGGVRWCGGEGRKNGVMDGWECLVAY